MYLPKIKIISIDEKVKNDVECINESLADTESKRSRIVDEVSNLLKKMSVEVKRFLEDLDQISYKESDKYIPGSDIKNYLRNKYKIDV